MAFEFLWIPAYFFKMPFERVALLDFFAVNYRFCICSGPSRCDVSYDNQPAPLLRQWRRAEVRQGRIGGFHAIPQKILPNQHHRTQACPQFREAPSLQALLLHGWR